MSTTTMPEYTRKLMEIWDNRDKHGFHELVEIIESEKKKAHRFGVFDAIHMIALDHGWEESEAFYVKMAKEKLLSDTQKETKP